ncbi:amidase family protein [Nocardioides sp. C4-1]|uniref:amidase family protein n=1 Tax=Nocardioides sp. C4-1 TaxID=3151851 RepID=UPI00326671BF
MNRRARALAATVALALPLGGVGLVATAPSGQASSVAPPSRALPADLDLDLETLTAVEARQLLADGAITSVELTQAYIDRINALNKSGPGLNAFTQLNKQALLEAARTDELRAAGTDLGPTMGMPVLLKDLIDVKGMYTSAGNFSLRRSYPAEDAGLVTKLRESGVVILGKVGLSEYANYFGSQPSGFSNLLGQVVNGVDADQNPSGSSSGTGSSMAAAMSLLGIGTETSGSIISPSNANGLVGLRPTVGLVPGIGIAPISASQDTAGPMTRTVEDAAYTLQAIAGYDAENAAYYSGIWGAGIDDEDIIPPLPAELPDYLDALDLDYVAGKRIGWNGTLTEGSPLKQAYDALVAAGAIMVERPVISPGTMPSGVLAYEARRDIDHYYENLGPDAPVQSLEEELAVNEREWHQALKFGNGTHRSAFAQDISPGSADTATYQSDLVVGKQRAQSGIDRMMGNDTPDDASDDFIAILGSVSQGPRAGYPQLAIPMGYGAANRRTLNVSVHGGAYDELDLLGVAYVIEQGTRLRQPASEVNPAMYRCADTVPAPPYAERGSCNPTYDEVMELLGGQAPAPLPFSLETESAQSLGMRLQDGTLTATALTRAYLYRIALTNAEGPATQAVRDLDPTILDQAAAADVELAAARAEKRQLDPLFGLPVLVSDGYDVASLPSSGGSIALQERVPAADATIVAALEERGALVLGTTNVTELGGVVDTDMPQGYSALGGQVLLPSDTDKTPAGSSAGAAAATSSGLAAITFGLETSPDAAQLLAPANAAGVVGLKPTVGLVSRTGVMPVARSQDSPGPIARTVFDAALALNAMAGPDATDPATADAPADVDYTASLDRGALAGRRIAVVSSTSAPYNAMVAALTAAGATTTQVTPGTPASVPSVVDTEIGRDLDAFLAADATGGAGSLDEVLAYNTANAQEGLKYQQERLAAAGAVDLADPTVGAAYEADLAAGRAANRAVIDGVLTNGTPDDASDDFDAILVPAASPVIASADRAGYPALTVPAGYGTGSAGRNPVGVTFVGTAYSEARLLADAHALEVATDVRRAVSWTNPSMWRCVPGSTFFTGAYCNTGDRYVLAADPTQGVVQPQAPAPLAVTGADVAATYGRAVALRVLVTGLPANATGRVTFARGSSALGSAPVGGDGSASLTVPGRRLPVGRSVVTATYTGQGGTARGALVVTMAKAPSTLKARVATQKVVVGKTRARVVVTVAGVKGVAATGRVALVGPGIKSRQRRLSGGRTTFTLPRFAKVGVRTLTVRYAGNGTLRPSTDTVRLRVVRRR